MINVILMYAHTCACTEIHACTSHVCKHTLTHSYLYISYVPLCYYTGIFLHFRADKLLVGLQFQCSIKVCGVFSFFSSRIKPVASSSFHEIHFFEAYEYVKFSVGGLPMLCTTPEHGGMRFSVRVCFLRWVGFTMPQASRPPICPSARACPARMTLPSAYDLTGIAPNFVNMQLPPH
jgi:hypothetical protein